MMEQPKCPSHPRRTDRVEGARMRRAIADHPAPRRPSGPDRREIAFNLALPVLDSRHGLRMLRGYAITFLVIQGYTLYFWDIAGQLGPVLASFLAGAATLGLVVHLEFCRSAVAAT